MILDEYHYGAWRESAKELFEAEDKKEVEFAEGEGIEDFDEDIMRITTDGYLIRLSKLKAILCLCFPSANLGITMKRVTD